MTGSGNASQLYWIFEYSIGPFPAAAVGATTLTFTFTARDPQTTVSTTRTVDFRGSCSD